MGEEKTRGFRCGGYDVHVFNVESVVFWYLLRSFIVRRRNEFNLIPDRLSISPFLSLFSNMELKYGINFFFLI
jgi:hypothetical protein